METIIKTVLDDRVLVNSSPLLRAADAHRVLASEEVIREANERAAATIREAQQQAEQIREQARREGWLSGRNEAARHHIETVLGSLRYMESLQDDFMNLVIQSVGAIVKDLPQKERMYQLAAKALQVFQQQPRITFRCHPQDLETASADLASMKSMLPEGVVIDITASEEVPRSGVFVETPLGVVDASLETQLENLRQALQSERA